MRGDILPLPKYVFVVLCLVKHRDKFTFIITIIIMNVFARVKHLLLLLPSSTTRSGQISAVIPKHPLLQNELPLPLYFAIYLNGLRLTVAKYPY
jgi:hypothetical protein